MLDFFKKFIKRWFRNFLTLLALAYYYPGFKMGTGLVIPIVASLFLNLIQVFLQPLLKLLFLPVNIITLGMFRWILEAVHLLIVSYFVRTITFVPFSYTTFTLFGIHIPGGDINLIFSVIIGSILFKFTRQIVRFLA